MGNGERERIDNDVRIFNAVAVAKDRGLRNIRIGALPNRWAQQQEAAVRFQRSSAHTATEFAKRVGIASMVARLRGVLIQGDGLIIDLGDLSYRVVTTAGVNFIVDAFQGLATLANMKYHGLGTGAGAEAVGDAALAAEVSGATYSTGSRALGSQGEGASANVYRTTATNTLAIAATITEHGVFDTATRAAGTLLDRSLFTGLPLAIGDGLQTQYDLTVNAGG